MTSLKDHLQSYGAYHRNRWNCFLHYLGVPLVTFSLFLFLGWFRFTAAPDSYFTGATIFYIAIFIYYLRLDWQVCLIQAPFTIGLLAVADRAAQLPIRESAMILAGTFVGGWAIQLIGHAIERRRPALLDNLGQVLNAPLFLTVEAVVWLGWRHDLLPNRG